MISAQVIIPSDEAYGGLCNYLHRLGVQKILVVCGKSCDKLPIGKNLDRIAVESETQFVFFRDFAPNPDYSSVIKGVEAYKKNGCGAILAIGGGSAMDVAKCIKLYSTMPGGCDYIHESIVPNDIPFVAVPTTAGTGSEATRFAVIYYNGEKMSVTDYSCIPSAVLFDPSVLDSLPAYQRKSTMMDAFCHAVESFWSVNSTDVSRAFSKNAIQTILEYSDSYLNNDSLGNQKMLEAANVAGKAINISQTTAGHAMCYKLTGLYGLAHGHAAALCVNVLWPYMLAHVDRCVDSRGKNHLLKVFDELAEAMGVDSPKSAADKFSSFLEVLRLETPRACSADDFDILKNSVNPVRLKNNPVKLDEKTIDYLYHQILGE